MNMYSSTTCQGCVYWNCSNLKNSSSEISFFSFPVKDNARVKQWLLNCGNRDLFNLESEKLRNRVICEKHFCSNNITVLPSGKKLLTRNAVPKHYDGKLLTCSSIHF